MVWAIRKNDGWAEIVGGFRAEVTLEGPDGPYVDILRYPPNWPDLATAEEREAIGVFEIEEPEPAGLGLRVIGSAIEGDDLPRRVWRTEAIPLADLREEAKARVNEGAGAFRRRFITDITGQQATYLAKEQEAKAWTVGAPDADFPYLATEAAETGKSIAFIVALVLETAAVWRGLDAKIEGKRRGAAVAIEAATTAEAIAAAGDVDWAALLA